MRGLLGLAALAVILVASGCSTEDPQQRAAREEAEAWAAGQDGYTGEAHCSDSARQGWFVKQATDEFGCVVRRDDADCDSVIVRFVRETGRATVELQRRLAGCVTPP